MVAREIYSIFIPCWHGGRAKLSSYWHLQRQTSTKLCLPFVKSYPRLQNFCCLNLPFLVHSSMLILSSFVPMQCSWELVLYLANVKEYLSASDWYFKNIFWKCIFMRKKLLRGYLQQNFLKQEYRGWVLWQLSCSFSHSTLLTTSLSRIGCSISQLSLTRTISWRYQGQDLMNVQIVTFAEDPAWWPLERGSPPFPQHAIKFIFPRHCWEAVPRSHYSQTHGCHIWKFL